MPGAAAAAAGLRLGPLRRRRRRYRRHRRRRRCRRQCTARSRSAFL